MAHAENGKTVLTGPEAREGKKLGG